MGYGLGVDLGTTFTAAALHQPGRTEVVTLGSSSAAIPTCVWLDDEDQHLVGEAARARGRLDPDRFAAHFKRQLGAAPVRLGERLVGADDLMAVVLGWVVELVTEREAEPPAHVTLTHPANWGEYRLAALASVAERAGLDQVSFTSEPEAAAVHYAARERVEPGQLVAVYDLGGGTFDATVLRRTEQGFVFAGPAQGIDRLGGIDLDDQMLALVLTASDVDPDALDGPAARRLRDDCISAKIALSADVEAAVEVRTTAGSRTVRITRAEFEEAITPLLEESVGELSRTLARAEVEPADLERVLLVGGSSRIPLVGQLVTSTLGLPVAVDADPKNSIALGGARLAASQASAEHRPSTPDPPPPAPPPGPPGPPEPHPTPRHDGEARSKRSTIIVLVAAATAAVGLAAALWPDPGPDAQTAVDDDATATSPGTEAPGSDDEPTPVVEASFDPVTEGPFEVDRTWEFDGTTARVEVVLSAASDRADGVHREAILPVAAGEPEFLGEDPTDVVAGVASYFDIVLEPGEQLVLGYAAPLDGVVGASDVQQVFVDWAEARDAGLGALTERDAVSSPVVSESSP